MKFQRSNKTKEKKELWVSRTADCDEVNILGKLRADKVMFVRFVCADPFQSQFPITGDKNVLTFLIQGGTHLQMYVLLLCTQKKDREHVFMSFSIISVQNNPYANIWRGGIFCYPSIVYLTFEQNLSAFFQILS